MEKTIRILLASTFLFLGIIIGFIWSPVKNGICCANNNGNTYGSDTDGWNYDDDDGEDDLSF